MISRFLYFLFFTGCFSLLAVERPNVIIINIDNHDKGSLGYFGNKFIETPHIDKIFENGLRLQNFHTAGRCTSSRSALMTGRYHARNGALGTGGAWGQSANDGIKTIGDVFKQGGYQTALFGKWHMGDSHGLRPEDRGFDEVCSFENGAYLAGAIVKKGYDESPRTGEAFHFNHNGEYKVYEGWRTDIWFREAADYIENKRDENKPFFIYMATITAHGPHHGPKDLQDYYKEKIKQEQYSNLQPESQPKKAAKKAAKKSKPNKKQSYAYDHAADIGSLDRNVGRLMNKLDELNLTKNTIVVYMSDGAGSGPASVSGAELKAAALSKNPCAIQWAGKQPRDIEGPVLANIDVLATFAEICGIELSDDYQESIDGQSFAASLGVEAAKPWQNRVYVNDHQSTGERDGINNEMALKAFNVSTVHLPNGKSVSWKSSKVLPKGNGPETIELAKQAYEKWFERVLTSFPLGAYVQTQKTKKPVFMRSYPINHGPAGEGLRPYFLLEVMEQGTFVLDTNYTDYYGFEYKETKAKKTAFKIYKKEKEGRLPLSFDEPTGAYRFSAQTLAEYFKEQGQAEGVGKVEVQLSPGKYLINIDDDKITKVREAKKTPKYKLRVSRKIN